MRSFSYCLVILLIVSCGGGNSDGPNEDENEDDVASDEVDPDENDPEMTQCVIVCNHIYTECNLVLVDAAGKTLTQAECEETCPDEEESVIECLGDSICSEEAINACFSAPSTDSTAEPDEEPDSEQTESETPVVDVQEEQPQVTEETASSTDEEENLNEVVTVSPVYVYFIYAQDGQFLGYINSNRFDSDSICNGFGTYGNPFSSKSIWNEFGAYGSEFRTYSAFNSFSSWPPIIMAEDLTTGAVSGLYYLTTNSIRIPRIDPWLLLLALQADGCDVSR